MNKNDINIEAALNAFYKYFFNLTDVTERTKKHIATPVKKFNMQAVKHVFEMDGAKG